MKASVEGKDREVVDMRKKRAELEVRENELRDQMTQIASELTKQRKVFRPRHSVEIGKSLTWRKSWKWKRASCNESIPQLCRKKWRA